MAGNFFSSATRRLSDAVEGAIGSGDNSGDEPVRTNHQRRYQFFKFQAINGSVFVQNGSVFG
jgi:hypothetical protein